jgi:hypothetical protein
LTHDPQWPIAPLRPNAHKGNYKLMAEIEHLAYLAEIDRELEDPERVAASACGKKRCRRARACRGPETCTQSAMQTRQIEQVIVAEEAEAEALKARRAPRRRVRPSREAR